MLRVTIRSVKPDKEVKLRDWFAELMARQEEVRQTFHQESVRHEQAYLARTQSGLLLIYAVEAEDQERAIEAFRNSTLAIDSQHKTVMEDVLGDPFPAELLYDCALE